MVATCLFILYYSKPALNAFEYILFVFNTKPNLFCMKFLALNHINNDTTIHCTYSLYIAQLIYCQYKNFAGKKVLKTKDINIGMFGD